MSAFDLVRRVTSLWPRSDAERFADRLWPDRPQPVIGDDSFGIDCAPAAPAVVGDSPAGERIPQHMPPAGYPASYGQPANLPWHVVELTYSWRTVTEMPWGISDKYGVIIGRFDNRDDALAAVTAINP